MRRTIETFLDPGKDLSFICRERARIEGERMVKITIIYHKELLFLINLGWESLRDKDYIHISCQIHRILLPLVKE